MRVSPLIQLHHQGDALLAPYGPAPDPASAITLVEAFDPVPIEYAAIRTHAAIFDQSHRATLLLRGQDRLSFLNRMLTQELDPKKGFEPLTIRRSFWLNRKGRIDADLRLFDDGKDTTFIDVDIHAAQRTLTGLQSFIITEDCTLDDATQRYHRLSIHGPAAAALVARLSRWPGSPEPGSSDSVAMIKPNGVITVEIAGTQILIDRQDVTGEIGLELLIPADRALAVYQALATPWSARREAAATPTTDLARPIGWHALNIARIEAGTPLYNLDFGPNSLPHETGEETLNDRVSFKKGCYLGQEVVARMQSLGHPKQRLVALRIAGGTGSLSASGETPPSSESQAITGTPILASEAPDAPTVGAVTSSCISPMLGNTPIAFAMVKWSHSNPDTHLTLDLGTSRATATIQQTLRFWKH